MKNSIKLLIAILLLSVEARGQSTNYVINEARTTPIQAPTVGKGASAAVDRYGNQFIGAIATPVTVSAVQTPIVVSGILTPISVSASASWATPNAPTWSSATYAYTSITASYTTALTNSNALKFCRVMNKTDQDLLVSFDAGTTGVLVLSMTSEYFDFAANGKAPASNIQVKHNGVAPTGNNLYLSCYY